MPDGTAEQLAFQEPTLTEEPVEQLISEEEKKKLDVGRWYYGVVRFSSLYFASIVMGAADVAMLLAFPLAAATVLDMKRIREADIGWKPLYPGFVTGILLLGFIAAPIYLYRRHKMIGV